MVWQQTEADEPGSVQYNYQVWRQRRNEQINIETQGQAAAAGKYVYNLFIPTTNHIPEERRWDRPVVTLQVAGHPLTMAFHSFDQHLVVANETDMIRSV